MIRVVALFPLHSGEILNSDNYMWCRRLHTMSITTHDASNHAWCSNHARCQQQRTMPITTRDASNKRAVSVITVIMRVACCWHRAWLLASSVVSGIACCWHHTWLLASFPDPNVAIYVRPGRVWTSIIPDIDRSDRSFPPRCRLGSGHYPRRSRPESRPERSLRSVMSVGSVADPISVSVRPIANPTLVRFEENVIPTARRYSSAMQLNIPLWISYFNI